MTRMRRSALILLVALSAAVTACGTGSSTTARTAASSAPLPSSPVTSVSAPPTPAAAVTPTSAARPQAPYAPPRTPETAAGAADFVRAYFAAVNHMTAHDDIAVARGLSAYALEGCSGCDTFQYMGYYNIASAKRVAGRTDGNLVTITALDVQIDPDRLPAANAAVSFSASEYRLLDSHDTVVDAEPPSTATYELELLYLNGEWHLTGLHAST